MSSAELFWLVVFKATPRKNRLWLCTPSAATEWSTLVVYLFLYLAKFFLAIHQVLLHRHFTI